jgi:hypothetical protein
MHSNEPDKPRALSLERITKQALSWARFLDHAIFARTLPDLARTKPKISKIETRCHGKLSVTALLPGEGRIVCVKKATSRKVFNRRYMDVSQPTIAPQFVERFS